MSGLDDTLPASGDEPVLAHGSLPTKISRYEVEGKLGEGGNGVVLLARDPTLGRKVAIKILRSPDDEGEASQRLLREARAAAKLTHDNVIVIHEVGTFEDRVYVAMEHISGSSLAQWQKQREWREVLEMYVRAGRGLAAAHAAGLVHRDFKPDNVLVARDGRVRVTDFGIVSGIGIDSAPTRKRSAKQGDTPSPELTRTGTVMGTPRYMAPEQHLAHKVDARADQFSFCVSLYEGVFRALPFDGATYADLATRVLEGEVAPPPADSPVPAGVRDAIMRGLSRAPDDRFASMDELLGALIAEPVRSRPVRRRRTWEIAAALAIAIAGVVVWVATHRGAPPIKPTKRTTEAELAFDRAQWAYSTGDYKTAIKYWKQAFANMPDMASSGQMLYNMALAYTRLGDCYNASFTLQRYLAISPQLADVERKKIEQQLVELEPCAQQKDKEMRARAAEAGSGTIEGAP